MYFVNINSSAGTGVDFWTVVYTQKKENTQYASRLTQSTLHENGRCIRKVSFCPIFCSFLFHCYQCLCTFIVCPMILLHLLLLLVLLFLLTNDLNNSSHPFSTFFKQFTFFLANSCVFGMCAANELVVYIF